jgi:hypothetical protein
VNPCADGSPEYNENASEADQAKGNATRFQANMPHSRYEGVDSEKLEAVYQRCLTRKTLGDETHKGDQGDS